MAISSTDFYGNQFDANGTYVGTDYASSQQFAEQKVISDLYQESARLNREAEDTQDPSIAKAALAKAKSVYDQLLVLRKKSDVPLSIKLPPEQVVHSALLSISIPGVPSGGGGVFVPGQIPVDIPSGTIGNVIAPRQIATSLATIIGLINSIGKITSTIEQDISTNLTGAVEQISSKIDYSTQSVIEHIDGLKDILTGFGNSLFGGIGDVLNKIGSFIKDNVGSIFKDVLTYLQNHMGKLIENIGGLIKSISEVVDKIAKEIQMINDTIIQPITTTILATIQTIGTLTQVIERDLHSGLQGILSIPTDIANALGSLDATFQRSVDQMHLKNKEIIRILLGANDDASIHERFSTLFSGINGGHNSAAAATTFTDRVHLTEPTLEGLSGEIVKEMIRKGTELLNIFTKSYSTVVKDMRGNMSDIPAWVGYAMELIVWLILFYQTTVEDLEPILIALKQEATRNIPTTNLDAKDALRAWVRGFITHENMVDECRSNGFDESRIQVLKDLQRYLRDVESALDMFYRGIISEKDLKENMVQHGMIPEQQAAAIAAGWRKVSVETAAKAFRYGILSESEFEAALKASRFTDTEIILTKETLLQREGVDDLILRHKYDTLYSNRLLQDQLFNTLPGDITDAAKRDGLSSQVAYDRWLRQLNVPPLAHWIELYFRRIRTHSELMAAMDFYRVPQDWRDDYIRVHQPILPYRTLPAMVAHGVITEDYAKLQLEAHGFSQENVNALLRYGDVKKKTIKVAASGDLHLLSVGNAKKFWELGAITDAQYLDMLKAHGYDDHTAELTLHIEQLQQTVHERKQLSTDIVNEVLSGLISVDDAQAQMSSHQFSESERAKVLRSIARVQRSSVKTPAESELRAMVKEGVIDVDDYRAALGVHGFASKWIEAFVKWHFKEQSATA